MIEENKRKEGYFPPHLQKDHYFRVDISGVKETSLLQNCLRKLTDLNFDKCKPFWCV